MSGKVTQEVLITPQMASAWLAMNTNNRRVNKDRVMLYASIMKRGGWHSTHQGIAFYCDGSLADGQHRLMAVVAANTPVSMQVTHGMPVDVASAVDGGQPRSLRQHVEFRGMDTRNGFVPAARSLFHAYNEQRGSSRYAVAAIDTDLFIAFSEAARPAIEFAVAPKRARGLSHATVSAAVAAAWFTKDRDRLCEFRTQLFEGVITNASDSAVIRLRDWLQTSRMYSGSARPEIWRRTCTALVAYLEYRPLSKLYAREDATFPIPDLL